MRPRSLALQKCPRTQKNVFKDRRWGADGSAPLPASTHYSPWSKWLTDDDIATDPIAATMYAIAWGILNHSFSCSYDAADNLTFSSESGSPVTFTLDAAGRIQYADSPTGRTTYTYDATGNQTKIQSSSGIVTMAYDPENHLRSSQSPGMLPITYVYDGDGKKRIKNEYGGLTTLVWDGEDYLQEIYANNASFVSQVIPANMTAGVQYPITLTFTNTGTRSWTDERNYALGIVPYSQTTVWTASGVPVTPGVIVPPGSNFTFVTTVTAPSTPGTYTMQWQVGEVYIDYFGALSPVASVVVS